MSSESPRSKACHGLLQEKSRSHVARISRSALGLSCPAGCGRADLEIRATWRPTSTRNQSRRAQRKGSPLLLLLLCLVLCLARAAPAQDAAAISRPALAAVPADEALAPTEGLPDDAPDSSASAPPPAPLPDVVAETTATLATTSVPLGLVDALGILRAAESLLGASDSLTSAPTPPARIEQAAARVEVVARYMERLAVAMREQVRYDWYPVERMGVKPGVNNSKRIALGAVQRGVQALRVRPAQEDVHLSYLKVEDAQGLSQTLAPNRDLAGDLPKWEVVYLGVPMNVTAVTVTARQSGAEKRRLLIELGVPRPPDYSREVAALCRQCQAFWREGHDSDARAALAQAVARLNDFRGSLASMRSRKPAAVKSEK